jgi:tyrosyl-tRNA synthetase
MVGSLLNKVIVSHFMKSVEEQLALIKRGAEEVLVEAELVEKLKTGKPLRN